MKWEFKCESALYTSVSIVIIHTAATPLKMAKKGDVTKDISKFSFPAKVKKNSSTLCNFSNKLFLFNVQKNILQ